MNHQNRRIAVLSGDGIGPEVMREAVKVLRTVASKFSLHLELNEAPVGWAGIDAAGKALPDATLALCKECDAILFGSVGLPDRDPTVPRHERPERAALMRLRSEFKLFANLRPVRLWPELAHTCPLVKERQGNGIDLLVVRELTGGLYFGKPKAIEETGGSSRRAVDTMVYTTAEIERIAHLAFEVAESRAKSGDRRQAKVTSIDKANVLENGALWRDVVTQVGRQYPGVQLEHMLVDNAAMQLVLRPAQFDVILCENLMGDILSDEAAALAGSLGMVPSASLAQTGGDRIFGLYEPAGGTAPDIAGKGIANPIAQILSAALMLLHTFKHSRAYEAIMEAVGEALRSGYLTGDISNRAAPHARSVTTSELGDAIARNISKAADQ